MTHERAWARAARVTALVVGGLLAVLVATGIALAFRYRPDVTFGETLGARHGAGHGLTARGAHRVASILLLPTAGALAVSCIGLFLVRHDRACIALPFLIAVLVLAASLTGFLLPWDQLGLRAITAGTDLHGYGPILTGHSVRFVLIGSREVSTATIARWFWVHTVGLPIVLAAALTALAIRARRVRRAGQPTGTPSRLA